MPLIVEVIGLVTSANFKRTFKSMNMVCGTKNNNGLIVLVTLFTSTFSYKNYMQKSGAVEIHDKLLMKPCKGKGLGGSGTLGPSP